MRQKKDSRFDELFSAARQGKTEAPKHPVQPDVSAFSKTGHLDVQTSKSKDPNYQRTTVYLPKPLHRRLKAAAATDGREMSDIVEELLEQWLNSKKDV